MDIKIRPFQETDLDVIGDWYDVPLLPEIRGDLGLIAEQDGTLIACGFLIKTSVCFCLWEYVQTNKNALHFTRAKAVKLLTEAAIDLTRSLGFKGLMGFTPAKNTALLKFYKRIGAFQGGTDFRLVMKRV